MVRSFPVLALIAGTLLVAGLSSAWMDHDRPSARFFQVATWATIAVHSIALGFVGRGWRRIESTSVRLGLPAWVGAQGEKNSSKALVLAASGISVALLGLWGSGLKVDEARLAILAFNVAFQLGAFGGEFAALVAQARLRRGLADWPGVTGVS